ncbi:hypothetical protein [Actinophytocola xanthii]|uniref:DUF445 domain-containing protein n=1 Tax=Actinophytocola xanthii TaxID=1912961 RepID=A0A1Q8C0Q3_9PSEU|nr:hypothetical protein [Actinophytocola xanthii]OLF07953.1 hypothetical protein BU204_34790 [Actinophytocola xanthii]
MATWLVYACMPVMAAVIGYVTKRVAIEMMFRPVRFVGLREPWLGWQGVVPRNSGRMIRMSADLLTERLVDPQEVFERLDGDRIAGEIRAPLLLAVEEITRDAMDRYRPGLWDALPPLARELVLKRAQGAASQVVRRVLADLRGDIGQVLDVKQVATAALSRDKLIRLVRDISRPEMAFIARCGIYFGFLLGLVQTGVWALTRQPLVLPVFGALIGWFTDWLAIKLVFFPRHRRRFGPFAFQGVFQRRRDAVAKQYAEIVAREVMTVPNILDAVLRSERLHAIVRQAVRDTIDAQAGPFTTAISTQVKQAAADHAVRHLPHTLRHAEDYATEALDIRDTIASRIRRLSRVEYEALLRPAFRQDEWKLIAVGAVIGAVIGELQALLLLG